MNKEKNPIKAGDGDFNFPDIPGTFLFPELRKVNNVLRRAPKIAFNIAVSTVVGFGGVLIPKPKIITSAEANCTQTSVLTTKIPSESPTVVIATPTVGEPSPTVGEPSPTVVFSPTVEEPSPTVGEPSPTVVFSPTVEEPSPTVVFSPTVEEPSPTVSATLTVTTSATEFPNPTRTRSGVIKTRKPRITPTFQVLGTPGGSDNVLKSIRGKRYSKTHHTKDLYGDNKILFYGFALSTFATLEYRDSRKRRGTEPSKSISTKR